MSHTGGHPSPRLDLAVCSSAIHPDMPMDPQHPISRHRTKVSCCGSRVRLQAGLNVDSISPQTHAGNKASEGYKLDKPKLHFSEVKKLETKEPRWRNAGFLLKSKGILVLTSIGNVHSGCREL